MAKISIIIPTYNSAQYICEAIESVLNQTYKDFEIIVVDDGSTDNTKEVIKPYLNKIKYIYQQNSGPSAARNRGIKEAKGEYIAFLDADDIWLPQKLELQIKFMETYPNLGLTFADVCFFRKERRIIKKTFLKDKKVFKNLHTQSTSFFEKIFLEKIFNALIEENFVPTSTVVAKMECFNKVDFFDETLFSVEDRDMWLRIALFYDIGFINFPLVLKRFHETNISANQELALKSRLKVMKKFLNYSNLPIKSKKIIKQTINKIHFDLGYLYFTYEKFPLSRIYFRKFLKENPFIFKPWIYILLSVLPTSDIRKLKNLKEKIKNNN